MKRYRKMIFYAILAILVILISIYFYPRKINKEYQGIMYRLGDSKDTEHVKISIDGYLSKGLLKGDKFMGSIMIENKMNPQANSLANKKLSKLDFRFGSSHDAVLIYYDDSLGEFTTYGSIYVSRHMDKFTICVQRKIKIIRERPGPARRA
jgi:hypothetical protein